MLKNMKLSAGKCPLPDLDISFIYPTFAVSDESERPESRIRHIDHLI